MYVGVVPQHLFPHLPAERPADSDPVQVPVVGSCQLETVHRVLRPGGLALLTFKSKRSFRYGRGVEIEPDTFIPDIGEDAGVPHHYSDRDEVEALLKGFRILEINHMERIFQGGHHSSYWEVWVEKP